LPTVSYNNKVFSLKQNLLKSDKATTSALKPVNKTVKKTLKEKGGETALEISYEYARVLKRRVS